MILRANTVIYPRAMMIKSIYALIANIAVSASVGANDLAFRT